MQKCILIALTFIREPSSHNIHTNICKYRHKDGTESRYFEWILYTELINEYVQYEYTERIIDNQTTEYDSSSLLMYFTTLFRHDPIIHEEYNPA